MQFKLEEPPRIDSIWTW